MFLSITAASSECKSQCSVSLYAVRLYDRRMAGRQRDSSRSVHRVRWMSCYVPTHLKGTLTAQRGFISPFRSVLDAVQ